MIAGNRGQSRVFRKAARGEHWLTESLFVRFAIEGVDGDPEPNPKPPRLADSGLIQTGATRVLEGILRAIAPGSGLVTSVYLPAAPSAGTQATSSRSVG